MLADAFAALTRPSTKAGFVRDALVAAYPKLAQLLETMFERLVTETSMKGVLPAVGPEQLTQLLGATAPLQVGWKLCDFGGGGGDFGVV